MSYAIRELHSVLSKITSGNPDDKNLIYASALLSELAYYHVPEWERDAARRRALLFSPSLAHRELLRGNALADVVTILRGADFGDIIIAETPRIVAIAIKRQGTVYVAMRGTLFLYAYDWRVNFNARVASTLGIRQQGGSFHSGFLTEAERICGILSVEIERQHGRIDHLHVCGHSLGGAVAAISEIVLGLWLRAGRTTSVIFGCPRYFSAGAYLWYDRRSPLHVRRKGDLVPSVPPRRFGYSDIIREQKPDGTLFTEPPPCRLLNLYILPWLWFVGRFAAPHSMERYRLETGAAAGAAHWDEALTDAVKLRAKDLRQIRPPVSAR